MTRKEYFKNGSFCMSENNYSLLSNAFSPLEDMTDSEDLLLQDMATFDDETIYTIAAMVERIIFILGGEKSVNTDMLMWWREHRIKDRGEIVYSDDLGESDGSSEWDGDLDE